MSMFVDLGLDTARASRTGVTEAAGSHEASVLAESHVDNAGSSHSSSQDTVSFTKSATSPSMYSEQPLRAHRMKPAGPRAQRAQAKPSETLKSKQPTTPATLQRGGPNGSRARPSKFLQADPPVEIARLAPPSLPKPQRSLSPYEAKASQNDLAAFERRGLPDDIPSATNKLLPNYAAITKSRRGQVSDGDIIAKAHDGKSYYVHDDALHEIAPEKAQLLQRLFPNGLKNSNFKQGELTDCVLLASIKSTLHNNPENIINMLHPPKDGIVEIALPGRKPITLNEKDIQDQGVKGDPGVQLLERAYGLTGKSVTRINTKKALTFLNPSETMPAFSQGGSMAYLRTKNPYVEVEGKPKQIVPLQMKFNNLEKPQVLRLLDDIAKNPKNNIALVVPRGGDPYLAAQSVAYPSNHAYSVLNVDPDKQNITLANPWDSQKHFPVSYDDFFNNFANVFVTKQT